MRKIPVLYYHDVVARGEGFSYQKIEEQNFEDQMKYLFDNGYKSIRFSDIIGNPAADYKKCVVITFDDGFKGVVKRAVPILKKYGFVASVFVATGLLNTDGLFSLDDAVKYSNEGVLELCAHTETHPDMRYLSKDQIADEFIVSNKKLTEITKNKPRIFCIPFGAYDKKSAKYIFEIGAYDMVFASFYGFLNTANFKNKLLPRIGIKNEDGVNKFASKVKGRYNLKGTLQKMRNVYRNMLGNKLKFNKDGKQ